MRLAFSRLSTPIAASGVSIYGYTAERCTPAGYGGPGRKKKLKICRDAYSIQREIVRTDTLIRVKLLSFHSDSVRLNDVWGPTQLPRKRWREDPSHAARRRCAETALFRTAAGQLLPLADTDPLLRLRNGFIPCRSFFLFDGYELEVVSALLSEKYKLETVVKGTLRHYMERPLKAASHTIHIEVPPNPFWASIETVCYTTLALAPVYNTRARVSLGYLNQSFQNAVGDGIRYGLEQGLFGWNVTDCKICFTEWALLQSVSTPADFRSLAPVWNGH